MQEAIFDITGMTCSMCVKHIERATNKLAGMQTAEVNLLTATLKTVFDPQQLTIEQIIAAVQKAGYGANIVSTVEFDKELESLTVGESDAADSLAACKLEADTAEQQVGNADNSATAKSHELAATDRQANSAAVKQATSLAAANSVQTKSTATDILAPIRRELQQQTRKLLIAAVALFFMFALTMFPMLHLNILPAVFSYTENPLFNAYCQLLLSVLFLYLYRRTFFAGFRSLLQKMPNMESLVAIGSISALLYSVVQLGAVLFFNNFVPETNVEHIRHIVHDLYFESFATILFVVNLGKVIELYTQSKTRTALSTLENLRPKSAKVWRGGRWQEVDVATIMIGEKLLLEPYSTVALDGEVVSGQSFLDESSLSGETLPVFKETGDKIRQGAINGEQGLEYVALKSAGQSSLQTMIDLVYQTLSSKASITKLVDRLSLYFVPLVISLATLTLLFWLFRQGSLSFALSRFMAVLLISCPCALGLAAPLSVMLTSGKAAQAGILFKSAAVLEKLAKVDYICFDKTGTLTENALQVVEFYTVAPQADKQFIKRLIADIETHSKHPIAQTLIKEFSVPEKAALALSQVKEVKASGLQAVYEGQTYYLGKPKWLQELGVDAKGLAEALKKGDYQEALTVVLATQTEILAVCRMFDVPKVEAAAVLPHLHKLNLQTAVLSGDNSAHVAKLAKQLSLSEYKGDLLPADKLTNIKDLQAEHKVLMVGDGINDLAAMAQADVAMALLSSTDMTNEVADVVVLEANLWSVYNAIQLSRLCLRKIKGNLFWALFYNCICIPLAAGFLPYKLNPMWAALAMGLSSTFVVLNSLLINLFKLKR